MALGDLEQDGGILVCCACGANHKCRNCGAAVGWMCSSPDCVALRERRSQLRDVDDPTGAYETRRTENIARNKAELAEMGFVSEAETPRKARRAAAAQKTPRAAAAQKTDRAAAAPREPSRTSPRVAAAAEGAKANLGAAACDDAGRSGAVARVMRGFEVEERAGGLDVTRGYDGARYEVHRVEAAVVARWFENATSPELRAGTAFGAVHDALDVLADDYCGGREMRKLSSNGLGPSAP